MMPSASRAGTKGGAAAGEGGPNALGALSLVGSVVERAPAQKSRRPFRRRAKKHADSSNGGGGNANANANRQSRFMASTPTSANVEVPASEVTSSDAPTGFPSLDHPIGTFVHQGRDQQGPAATHTRSKGTATTKAKDLPVGKADGDGRSQACNDDNEEDDEMPPLEGDDTNPDVSYEKQKDTHGEGMADGVPDPSNHSSNDASAMVTGMSKADIQESLNEISAILSPQAISFLKRRGAQKKNKQQQEQQQQGGKRVSFATPSYIVQKEATAPTNASASAHSVQSSEDSAARAPHAGTDQALASVQTYEQLDALYLEQKERSGDYDAVPHSTVPENETEFETACRLLRSTSPRQILWAVKVVTETLQSNRAEADQTMQQRQRPPPSTSPSLPKLPDLLAVSLRCILDQPTSKLNGFQLHSLVLQSLHSLVLLYSNRDHVVSVDMHHAIDTIEEDSVLGDATADNHDHHIHVTYLMDDAIPTPSLDKLYAPTTIEPVSNPNIPKSKTGEAAAYATNSSSTSANSDAKAFANDPMWTLLSKMKMIPRLAQLLKMGSSTIAKDLDDRTDEETKEDGDTGAGTDVPRSEQQSASAQSQRQQQQLHDDQAFPPEGVIAAAGILAMIGQRSPGAASAIMHHPTLISNLLDLSLRRQSYLQDNIGAAPVDDEETALPGGTQGGSNEFLARTIPAQYGADFAVLTLLRTLARQSRVVAQAIDEKDILLDLLPPLLCSTAQNQHEHSLQRQGLILWRTMLRYGLGLSGLSTMSTLSARHLAIGQWDSPKRNGERNSERVEYPLSNEFLSCFAEVLNCTKVLYSKPPAVIVASKLFNQAQVEALTLSTTVLSSTRSVSLSQLIDADTVEANIDGDSDANKVCSMLVWNAVRMRVLSAFLNLPPNPVQDTDAGDSKSSDSESIAAEDQVACLSKLFGWLRPDGLVEYAWKQLLPYVGAMDLTAQPVRFVDRSQGGQEVSLPSAQVEASCSAFLESLVSLVIAIEQNIRMSEGCAGGTNPALMQQLKLSLTSILDQINAAFMEGIAESMKFQQIDGTSASSSPPRSNAHLLLSIARRGWINRGISAVGKLLTHEVAAGVITASVDISRIRYLIFAMVGRLEHGNESLAAILFSQDLLFQLTGNPLLQSRVSAGDEMNSGSAHSDARTLTAGDSGTGNIDANVNDNDDGSPFSAESASPISSMFLGELCGTPSARKQLDHSFKLHHGFGITPEGFGAFALDSLLSTSDHGGGHDSQGNSGDGGAERDTDDNARASSTFTLPMGKQWLWQTLSGFVQVKDASRVDQGSGEATKVVAATLGIILELEQVEDLHATPRPMSTTAVATETGTKATSGSTTHEQVQSTAGYAPRLSLGSKMYYLMNVCLHPESVLREDRVTETAESILQRYLPYFNMDDDARGREILVDFATACVEHTSPGKDRKSHSKASQAGGSEAAPSPSPSATAANATATSTPAAAAGVGGANPFDDKLNPQEEQLMAFFNPNIGTGGVSSDGIKSLEAFLEDLANAYKDYGAQYDFFTMIVRLFLLPLFPGRIRCRAIDELRSIAHLLTLPREIDDASAEDLSVLLAQSMLGGLPSADQSKRDDADVLDAVTLLISPSNAIRPADGYIVLLGVGMLVRCVATAASRCGGSNAAIRSRLLKVHRNLADAVIELASALLEADGSKQALVGLLIGAYTAGRLDVPFRNRETISRNVLDEQLVRKFGLETEK